MYFENCKAKDQINQKVYKSCFGECLLGIVFWPISGTGPHDTEHAKRRTFHIMWPDNTYEDSLRHNNMSSLTALRLQMFHELYIKMRNPDKPFMTYGLPKELIPIP